MTQTAPGTQTDTWNPRSLYEKWMAAQELPVYRGHYAHLAEVELAPWADHDCTGAFIYFQGMEDLHEGRVTEIGPAKTAAPNRIALEELVYIISGRGLCTVWAGDREKKTFEWGPHSIFMIPPNYTYQLSNASGTTPARILQTNYLPLALLAAPNLDFFFKNDMVDYSHLYGDDTNVFSEAILTRPGGRNARAPQNLFVGNFLPDMAAWDQLEPFYGRGAGGTTVFFRSRIAKGGHMSVFEPGSYKKAHRHGPGRVIIIPAGEGYTAVWPNLKPDEVEIIPWKEGTCFTPPEQWYHQHFNIGTVNARYIAFGSPALFSGHNAVFGAQQIEYPDQAPWVRERFEGELAKHGITSIIPEEAYKDRNFEWDYGDDN
jgi:oxalate decarboxylase/phosphoglucose isomerase-like protein (cupin superfamily)